MLAAGPVLWTRSSCDYTRLVHHVLIGRRRCGNQIPPNHKKKRRKRRKSCDGNCSKTTSKEGKLYRFSMTSLKRHLGNGPLTISVPTVERWPFFSSSLAGRRRTGEAPGSSSSAQLYREAGWVTTEGNIVLWHLEQLRWLRPLWLFFFFSSPEPNLYTP